MNKTSLSSSNENKENKELNTNIEIDNPRRSSIPLVFNTDNTHVADITLGDGSTLLLDDEEPYLSNIYNLFLTLNKKIELLDISDSLYSLIKHKRIEEAMLLLQPMVNKNIISKINKREIIKIKEEIENMVENIENYKQKIIERLNNIKIELEYKRECGSIIEYISYSLSNIPYKDNKESKGSIKDNNTIITNNIDNIKRKIDEMITNYTLLYKENINLSSLLSSNEINSMHDINNTLSTENVKLRDNIILLRDKNIELQKENVMLSSELYKYKDILRDKVRIIERQKNIIEILQGSVGKNKYVDEIRSKIHSLKLREKEVTQEEKEDIKKEIKDYEKRLKDFIGISK